MQQIFNNFGNLTEEFSNYENSKVVILPVPYEGTITYGSGTALGPDKIIEASRHIELYDIELKKNIHEIGIFTSEPPDLSTDPKKTIINVYKECKTFLDDSKFICILGGEHSITSGCVRAFKEKYHDLSVLQIDAHSDLREEYGEPPNLPTKYSHASVMKRIFDMNIPIVQVGIRSMCDEEAVLIEKNKIIHTFFAKDINNGGSDWMDKAISHLTGHVYITFDIDGFDPGFMPSTGTPEPGGLQWWQTLEFLRKVANKKEVVGFDIVELAPIEKLHAPNFKAAKLVYKLIGYSFEKKKVFKEIQEII